MRCKKCGALLLDTDTYCGKCGAKVEIDVCPNCGELLRPGMTFCAKCGSKVIADENKVAEDDDIPVTGQITTTDIPFDIIEANIIKDVQRQLDDPIKTKNTEIKGKTETCQTEEPEDEYPESEEEDEEEYSEDESEDYYEDEDESEDYSDEDEDDSDDSPSIVSRLITAGMIVAGLVLVLLVAALFFNNRKDKTKNTEETQVTEEQTTEETEETSDGTIGTVTIIDDVNIRDNPSTDNSTVMKVAREGEQYKYYGYSDSSNNWIHIKVDDSTDGYVYKDYVEIDQ